MNAFELLQNWPSWKKASAETIFNSAAWAMPVRWRDTSCIMRKADVTFRDVLGISIRLDDEENFIGIDNRETFKDLNRLWDVRDSLPDALKLALVEKECGALLQIIENASRRQLTVIDVAPAERRAQSTGFEIVAQDGNIMATFDLKVTPAIILAFGLMKFIDVNHPSIRSMTRPARAVFATFKLTETEKANLAPGDYIMMPELSTVPSQWEFTPPSEGYLQICAPETSELTFAQVADAQLPEIAEPTVLELLSSAGTIARGRATKLAETPAFAIEEIL